MNLRFDPEPQRKMMRNRYIAAQPIANATSSYAPTIRGDNANDLSICRYDAARVMHGLTNCVRCRCGNDLSLISADQFGSYIEIPGGNIRVPLGYVGVLAPLLRDLPDCCVRFV